MRRGGEESRNVTCNDVRVGGKIGHAPHVQMQERPGEAAIRRRDETCGGKNGGGWSVQNVRSVLCVILVTCAVCQKVAGVGAALPHLRGIHF